MPGTMLRSIYPRILTKKEEEVDSGTAADEDEAVESPVEN
jgi:hypothetical protein